MSEEKHSPVVHEIWYPPVRCMDCSGHRVSDVPGMVPIETRSLGFWAWLAEIPMRRLAVAARKDKKKRLQVQSLIISERKS